MDSPSPTWQSVKEVRDETDISVYYNSDNFRFGSG